jgi:hypothetical protein
LAERIEKARLDQRPPPEQLRQFAERIVGAIEKQPVPTPQPSSEEKTRKKRSGRKKQSGRVEAARKRREKIMRPLLAAKKWSDSQWVIEAGKDGAAEIDLSVGYSYLAGKSFPQRRHEVRLAKAIGLEKLPR